MIREGNVVEVVIFVVTIEGTPAAVAALHAEYPFLGSIHRCAELRLSAAVHRQNNDCGVVNIRVMRIGILECPAPRRSVGATRSPTSTARKNQNHEAFCCGALGAGPTMCGGSRKSSSIATCRGLRALGLSACRTRSGTITVRLQYEILSR